MGYNEEDMLWFLIFLCIVIFAVLVIVSGISPSHSFMSNFELERRKAKGDKQASAVLHQELLSSDITAIQRTFSATLLVMLVALLVVTFGWFIGLLVSLLVALEYGSVARLHFVQARTQSLYKAYEPKILMIAEKYRNGKFRLITNKPSDQPVVSKLDSREELQYLVSHTADKVLADNDKKLLLNGLRFGERQVNEIMTPSNVIDSVHKKELLGPLVLNDLHEKGHSRFPVIDGDIDHVVGVLHVQDLLVLDAGRRSTTVERAMEPRVFYIRQDQTLDHALAAFLRTHHHLFIVVNELRETVGLLSLEDVIEALLGRKIIDEFDAHEDLRVVAARKAHDNNRAEKHEDV